MRLHITTWSNNHLVEFDSHESCKNRDITFFIRHATICVMWRLWMVTLSYKPWPFQVYRIWLHRSWDITFLYLSRGLTWSCEQKDKWLLSFWLLIISHHPVSGYKSRGNGDIMFIICHVTWCVHVINGLCNFVDNIISSETTSLSSLVAIGLVEVET